jgi:hypothetical protein
MTNTMAAEPARWSVKMNEPASEPKYQARLTETGLAVEDSLALCEAYLTTRDWSDVRARALSENLLGKGSQSRISKLLRAVERRVLHAPAPLDCPLSTARFLAARIPGAAKSQLLFVLALQDDVALADAFQVLVLAGNAGIVPRVLTHDEILRFLDDAARVRPEVLRWTGQTRARWAQGFRLVLRELGMASGSSGNQVTLRPLIVRDETIAFLCHAVADRGSSGWAIIRHDVLKPLLFSESDAVRAARALHARGWWSFAQSDLIMEFHRNHASLEEWLEHGLGT